MKQFQFTEEQLQQLRAAAPPLPANLQLEYSPAMEESFMYYHTDTQLHPYQRLKSWYYYLWHVRLYSGLLLDGSHSVAEELQRLRKKYQEDLQIVLHTDALLNHGVLPAVQGQWERTPSYSDWATFLQQYQV